MKKNSKSILDKNSTQQQALSQQKVNHNTNSIKRRENLTKKTHFQKINTNFKEKHPKEVESIQRKTQKLQKDQKLQKVKNFSNVKHFQKVKFVLPNNKDTSKRKHTKQKLLVPAKAGLKAFKSQNSTQLFHKNQLLYEELLKIHAYFGDSFLRNHYSQESFIFAYRNDYALYNLHSAILGLKKALYFLRKQKLSSLIFVGSPVDASEQIMLIFSRKNIQFFASNEWVPGFISRKPYNKTRVVVIYDLSTNHNAKREAFAAKFPIVAFFTMYADVSGVDYPINLNLEESNTWYLNLWKTFFLIK